MKISRKLKYEGRAAKLVGKDFWSFLKYLLLSLAVGIGVGAYASLFALLISFLTELRTEHMWLIFLLPVGGLAIVGLYDVCGERNSRGTDQVLDSISRGEALPVKMAPLITVATAITHLFGGSAGREGAALQIGGSLGRGFGKLLKLDSKGITLMTVCGMSAAFSAMFGTPLTAAVFAMEVVCVGVMQYSALLPCAVSSLSAYLMARLLGVSLETYTVSFPDLGWLIALEAVALGIMCAVVGCLFCFVLHKAGSLYRKYIPNPYLRVVVGGLLVILFTMICGTSDYNGAGMNIIEEALSGEAVPWAFLAKILMTALTLGAGFKGGEIVPSLFIGATFGCVFGPLIGIPADAAAALGLCGVFCAVTNCPISSILLAVEMCGADGLPLYLIVAAVSYRLSGYKGLYSSQKFLYSKSSLTLKDKNLKG